MSYVTKLALCASNTSQLQLTQSTLIYCLLFPILKFAVLIQISGESSNVRKALFQLSAPLHDNPSRSQHLLSSSTHNVHPSGGSLMGPPGGAPYMGLPHLVGAYGGYKGEGGKFRQKHELNLGKFSSKAEADDCIISISAKEVFDDPFSPAIEAALRLQPRSSEKIERDSGLISYTTRLLEPTSQIGCLIGKGGAIISEMRRISKANIRIISKENLPKVAEDDDEMVQVSIMRLRASLFEREGAMPTFVPVLPYLHVPSDVHDVTKYDNTDSRVFGRGHDDFLANNGYGSYGDLKGCGGDEPYGAYGSYSSGRSGSSGGTRHNSASRRRDYDY
ncbi:uncharacterized protein LOC143630109 [Bidens hawaiensis]|uniref:uncharacterized protein LOC143630109 n=1 Tax=Bidens hawaiensis TaxID=980011 RepID=UPI00404B9F10